MLAWHRCLNVKDVGVDGTLLLGQGTFHDNDLVPLRAFYAIHRLIAYVGMVGFV